MLKIQKYTKAKSLQEAYEIINKNRNNIIIGGMMWLKMEDRMVVEAVDLSNLNLNQIEEKENEYQIGAMCTLRQLELHKQLNLMCQNVIKDAVCDIVGVQFRNMATIGGSVYSRFGFSDVICALLALDCDVLLHNRGRISLSEFIALPYEKDIITHICIKKKEYQSAFVCVRRSATDLAVLNVAVRKEAEQYRIVVGARPQKATAITLDATWSHETIAAEARKRISCESNMRGSKQYRERLVEALTLKALKKLGE